MSWFHFAFTLRGTLCLPYDQVTKFVRSTRNFSVFPWSLVYAKPLEIPMLRPRIRAVSGFVHLLSFSFARHNNQGQVSVKTRVFPGKADAVDRLSFCRTSWSRARLGIAADTATGPRAYVMHAANICVPTKPGKQKERGKGNGKFDSLNPGLRWRWERSRPWFSTGCTSSGLSTIAAFVAPRCYLSCCETHRARCV